MANTFTPESAQKPAAATAAVCTMAAPTNGQGWYIKRITCTYSIAPAALSKLTIAWGSDSEIYYPGAGVTQFSLDKQFPPNTAVTVTLDSGATTVVGAVYVDAFTR